MTVGTGSQILSSVLGYCVYNDGSKAPMVGLCTRNLKKPFAENVVYQAIKDGIRAIDTALSNDNQEEIGKGIHKAISENIVKREQLFITTKLPDLYHDNVIQALRKELSALRLEYSNLHLVETPWQHEPLSHEIDGRYKTDSGDLPIFLNGSGIPIKKTKPLLVDTWKSMESAQKMGLTKSIGVMNFDEDLVEQILATCEIKPVTNQVECHFLHNQQRLATYLREQNIMMTANTCIPPVDAPETIIEIGKLTYHSAREVMVRFLCQSGIQVVMDASKMTDVIPRGRLAFALSGEEMEHIKSLTESKRFQYFKTTSVVESKNYPKSWTREKDFGNAAYSHIGIEARLL